MCFVVIFSRENIALQNISRTLATITFTFVLVGGLMLSIYGNFEIGRKKSKPIIFATAVAMLVTDIATYTQLMIMNTNLHNNTSFRLEQLDLLLYVYLLQVVLIVCFAYGGNALYFRLHSPKSTTVLHDNSRDLSELRRYFNQYKLQYKDVRFVQCNAEESVDEVIKNSEYIIFSMVDSFYRKSLVEKCYNSKVAFAFVPSIADVIEHSGENLVFNDVPVVHVSLEGLSVSQRIMKRILDILISIIGMALLLPITILVTIAIKLEDKGSVFFLQERYTYGGKVFRVIKFRTMKENVANYSSTEDDDRITKVGKILRKTRLDELPQFINVLIGDMSVVGPRPEMLSNAEKYEKILPEFRYRLRAKAGLTGIAQIEGKYNTSPEDKLLLDMLYIENYSIWMDVKLIFQTVTVVFKTDSTEGFDNKSK